VPETEICVHAVGTEPTASLPQLGLSNLHGAKYLRIARKDQPKRADVFEVASTLREGASGIDVYIEPGKLGLQFNDYIDATALPVTIWAHRRAQLNTPYGHLVLATLFFSVLGAWIDGALAIGKYGAILFNVSLTTMAVLAAISVVCKIVIPVLGFALVLLFKK